MIRIYITAAVTALLIGLAAYGLHSFSMAHAEKKHAAQLIALASAKDNACTLAKNITTGVSNDYQKDLTGLDADRAAVDSLLDRASACQPACAPSGCDAVAAGQKLPAGSAGMAGANPRKLIDIGRRAEKTRLQLKACQSFVRQTAAPKPPK